MFWLFHVGCNTASIFGRAFTVAGSDITFLDWNRFQYNGARAWITNRYTFLRDLFRTYCCSISWAGCNGYPAYELGLVFCHGLLIQIEFERNWILHFAIVRYIKPGFLKVDSLLLSKCRGLEFKLQFLWIYLFCVTLQDSLEELPS